jgi:hypothetical protein
MTHLCRNGARLSSPSEEGKKDGTTVLFGLSGAYPNSTVGAACCHGDAGIHPVWVSMKYRLFFVYQMDENKVGRNRISIYRREGVQK